MLDLRGRMTWVFHTVKARDRGLWHFLEYLVSCCKKAEAEELYRFTVR